ncbi:MAG: tetratricopeptide repeat protein [Proteobacteria bacterium]|nr:tetratricopeptide repeat protein [Pseudomonadota bacterium]
MEEAIVSMQTAALLLPGDAETHNNLGAALNEQGQSQAAETSLRRALELDPNSAEARCNLGAALEEQGRLADAEVSYRHSLKIKPNFAEAHSNLGNTLMKQGRLFEAETSYRRALELKPDYAEPLSALGNTFLKQGRLTEAAACLGRALEIKPDFAVAYNNLGNSQHAQGRITEAEASYRQALEINPDYAEAHNNLGVTLSEQGRLTEAEVCYRRALEIKLDYAEAHNNLGVSVMEQGRLTEAEACYRRALEIDPNYAVAYNCLGNILHNQDRLTEALAQYHQVMAIQPDDLQYAIHAHLLLPIIPQTLDMIQVWRARYQSGIAALMDATGSLDDPGNEVNPPSFYLAYQNYDDRSVMETLCRLFRSRVPNLTVTASHVDAWRPPVISGRRIRVGFLSQFLVSHTIGKLYQGFIRHLDRSRFEVVVIHAPRSKLDTYSQSLEAPANRVIAIPAKLKDQQKAVAEAKLDVLFYPDIGMAASTYFLAYARLAPVQVVSWGHPDTTGLDTMDYFLSSSFIEPKDAEAHYTEKLICLNRIPCYYQPLLAPNRIPARVTQGLPETGTLYGCPQSLFKFHPDFDAVLAAIAEGDPAGHIVLLEGANPVWVELLRARWAKTFPILLDRVLFLPRMPLERFMAFMAHVDILLDPVHFGSGNTLYEAMVYGTPLVTWAGQFMRGRIVAGAYQQMGIADAPIAPNLKDYAPLALALGRDHERRQNLRQASLKAAGRELFADMRAVREFEDFLEAAVAAAGHGEKLPAGWHPDIHVTQTQQGASA